MQAPTKGVGEVGEGDGRLVSKRHITNQTEAKGDEMGFQQYLAQYLK